MIGYNQVFPETSTPDNGLVHDLAEDIFKSLVGVQTEGRVVSDPTDGDLQVYSSLAKHAYAAARALEAEMK